MPGDDVPAPPETIPCSAPDCLSTFRLDLPPDVLAKLLDLHARTAHPPTAPQVPAPSTRGEKFRRPMIVTDGTSEDWLYFCQRWEEYKTATGLEGRKVVEQLLECAEEPLRKVITRTYGTLTNETEPNALENIRLVAVRPTNILVARGDLQNIHQDRDETVRAYCARLRGQASVCKFKKTKQCSCTRPTDVTIDYSDEMVRDALIRGLTDEDIRLEVLGQANQDMSLDETLLLIEAKESGRRSVTRLQANPTATVNASSSYRKRDKQKQSAASNDANSSQVCGHCGKRGHGSGYNRTERVRMCPAYNTTCPKCGVLHHFGNVCRREQTRQVRSSQRSAQRAPVNQEAVFQYENAYRPERSAQRAPVNQEAVFQYENAYRPESTTVDGSNQITEQDAMLYHSDDQAGFFSHGLFDFDQICAIGDMYAITLEHHVYDNLCKTWERRKSDPQPLVKLEVTVDSTDLKDLHLDTPNHQLIHQSSKPVVSDAIADTGCHLA